MDSFMRILGPDIRSQEISWHGGDALPMSKLAISVRRALLVICGANAHEVTRRHPMMQEQLKGTSLAVTRAALPPLISQLTA
jgi:hypothetical protein